LQRCATFATATMAKSNAAHRFKVKNLSDDNDSIEKAMTEQMPPVFQNVMKLTRLGVQLSRPFFHSYASDHDISLTEWRVLVVLHLRPGSVASDVSQFTGVHPMNVSRAIKNLEKNGRLISEPDETNQRRKLLKLTPTGKALYAELYPSSEKQAERLFEALSPAEGALFGELLDRLLERTDSIMNGQEENSP